MATNAPAPKQKRALSQQVTVHGKLISARQPKGAFGEKTENNE
jgi:hypothetical protein